METCRCSTMGALVPRRGSVLEDCWRHPRCSIRVDPQSDTRNRHNPELSPAAHTRRRPREWGHKASLDTDPEGNQWHHGMRAGNSPSMARASRLDRTGGVDGVSSSKKNEIEHGLNGRDAPLQIDVSCWGGHWCPQSVTPQ